MLAWMIAKLWSALALTSLSMFKLNTIAFMNPGARSQETPMRRANAEYPHSPVA
jgi:hypothetical protein